VILRIPKQRTKVKQRQLERALAILENIGAEVVRPEASYGITRVLDYLDDKNLIAKELGNAVCVKVLYLDCKNCPVGQMSDDCITKLGHYLVTKGPKRRIK
jgi:hypothetical protein